MLKKIFYFLLAIAFLFGLTRLYYNFTDDFHTSNYSYELPHNPEWDIPQLSTEEKQKLDQILSQEFYYLGKGAQSYAFSSQDGNYVLKLIKFKHIKPSLIMKALPSIPPFNSYKEKHFERKNKILTGVFSGYHLAYSTHKEESGIIFIHLNRTTNLNKTIILYDKLGIRRKVEADDLIFVVQHFATKTRDVLREALANGNIDLAKKRMNQIFQLYLTEYNKGIYDRDHGLMHNIGFIGEKVIHLDVGKLTRDESMKSPNIRKEDFDKVLVRLDTWLKANYPDAYPELAQEMQNALAEIGNNVP